MGTKTFQAMRYKAPSKKNTARGRHTEPLDSPRIHKGTVAVVSLPFDECLYFEVIGSGLEPLPSQTWMSASEVFSNDDDQRALSKYTHSNPL